MPMRKMRRKIISSTNLKNHFFVSYYKLQTFFVICSTILFMHATPKNKWESKTLMLTPNFTPPFHKLM